MSTQHTSTAPEFIAAETGYTGAWYATRRADDTLGARSAQWLADHIGDGNVAVIWEYVGHQHDGRLLYCRSRFGAYGGELHGFDSDGRKTIIHPADRIVRFLSA